MNARQAARLAAKKIEELEFTLALNKADIIDYNRVILDMIDGKGPCDYCEDLNECQRECKGKGCQEWLLRFRKPEETEAEASTLDDELDKVREKAGDPDGEAGTEAEPVQHLAQ